MVNIIFRASGASEAGTVELSREEIERREKLRKIARRNAREDAARSRERIAHAQAIANEGFAGACELTRSFGDDHNLVELTEAAIASQIEGIGVTEVIDNGELHETWLATQAIQQIEVNLLGKRVAYLKLIALLTRTEIGYEIAGWRATLPPTSARPTIEHVQIDVATPMSLMPPEAWEKVCAVTLECCPIGKEPDWIQIELRLGDVSTCFEARANAVNEWDIHYEMLIDDTACPALERTIADVVMTEELMSAAEAAVISRYAEIGIAVDPSGVW